MSKDIAIEVLKYLDFNDGVYFSAGAQDGLFQSNTVILERAKNWTGILVEPSPAAYSACLKNRSQEKNIIIHGALVSADYGKPTIMGDFFGHPMHSIGGKRLNNAGNSVIEVPAYTMNEILEKYNVEKIDFLSLDTEGFEYWILKDLNFEKWAPKWAMIEWNIGEDELFPFMESKGYECIGNISQFTVEDDPGYQNLHQDFLFKLKDNK
jgi:FkbM family methyltransferase